jgi:hypothetical protein
MLVNAGNVGGMLKAFPGYKNAIAVDRLPRSMPARTPRQHLLQHGRVGGLRLIRSVERQRLAASATRA